MIFSISMSEMGLNPFLLASLLIIGLFFLIAFIFTSRNMDVEGLLETLYGNKKLEEKD